MSGQESAFVGSIPRFYESLLVPLLFEPYAADLAARAASRSPHSVLELAAGTGAVTRHLAGALSSGTAFVATDLNQPMLEVAAGMVPHGVSWCAADAQRLPFDDATFDAVVCQFSVMFFPDKVAAFREARRLLRPGGVFLFNVWDSIATNEFPDVVTSAVGGLFPDDPPLFLPRIPYGYHDEATIQSDLRLGGFAATARVERIARRSIAASAIDPAAAFCRGTPLASEIEARDATRLDEATSIAGEAIAKRFGAGPVDGKMQALIVTVEA